jgi:cryptochrome
MPHDLQGGETEALARLKASMADAAWVAKFQKPDTDPTAFLKPATTVLSPYLKFGCLSPRAFHSQLMQVYK